jgi:hypothetical protein
MTSAIDRNPDMEKPDRLRPGILFRVFRAGHVAAIVWCAAMVVIAFYVRTPGKSRPGTHFAHDVSPTVLAVSFGLFVIGAAATAASKQARDSVCIKWTTCLAFALMILTLLLIVTGY